MTIMGRAFRQGSTRNKCFRCAVDGKGWNAGLGRDGAGTMAGGVEAAQVRAPSVPSIGDGKQQKTRLRGPGFIT